MKVSVCVAPLIKRLGLRRTFSAMKSAGIDYADFGLDGWHEGEGSIKGSKSYLMSDEETEAYYARVKETADEEGITVCQTHAIFGDFAAVDSEEYIEALRKNVIATRALGCDYMVVHPVALPGRLYDELYEEGVRYNLDVLERLLPHLKKYGVTACIESLIYEIWEGESSTVLPTVCSRPEEINGYIDVLGEEHFCACLDFGHASLTAKYTGCGVPDFIRRLGKRMKLVHIHENDGLRDTHEEPKLEGGKIDWKEVRRAMHEVGYEGVINFEVGGKYYGAFPDGELSRALSYLVKCAAWLSEG